MRFVVVVSFFFLIFLFHEAHGKPDPHFDLVESGSSHQRLLYPSQFTSFMNQFIPGGVRRGLIDKEITDYDFVVKIDSLSKLIQTGNWTIEIKDWLIGEKVLS